MKVVVEQHAPVKNEAIYETLYVNHHIFIFTSLSLLRSVLKPNLNLVVILSARGI